MSRPTIVLVSQIPLWSMGRATGGPAFRETLEHLGRRFEVLLVTPEVAYVGDATLPDGVELHSFRHRFHGTARSIPKLGWVFDTLGWYTFRTDAWPIVRRLCRERPVELAYGYEIYGVPVARRAADRFGLPMVARFQGTLLSARRHEPLARLRYLKHYRALETPADLVVMTDDGTSGDDVLRDLGHESRTVRFWMNGVDRSIAESPVSGDEVRDSLGIEPSSPLLLTVSRLSFWKRVERAIGVVARLRDEHDLYATLVIVGVGPEEVGLREAADAAGLGTQVRFVGGVERDRLAGYYRAADLLLSLYDYSNLANPVLEALTLGTPVLAFDVGGTSNLLEEHVNAALVDDPSPARVAERVATLLRDTVGLRALGERGATWARDGLWSWDERMSAEIDELERLLRDSER